MALFLHYGTIGFVCKIIPVAYRLQYVINCFSPAYNSGERVKVKIKKHLQFA